MPSIRALVGFGGSAAVALASYLAPMKWPDLPDEVVNGGLILAALLAVGSIVLAILDRREESKERAPSNDRGLQIIGDGNTVNVIIHHTTVLPEVPEVEVTRKTIVGEAHGTLPALTGAATGEVHSARVEGVTAEASADALPGTVSTNHPRNRTIQLASFRDPDTGTVENFHFEDCVIEGPAIVAVLSGTVLDRCTIEGEVSQFLWVVKPDRPSVIGAVGLRDVTFTRCIFRNVGFAVTEAIAKKFYDSLSREEGEG